MLLLLLLIGLLGTGCGLAAPFPAVESAPAAEPAGEPIITETEAGAESNAGQVPLPGLERKIVANADVDLVVADTAAAVEQIEGMLADLGGYISDANLYKSSYGEAELLRGTLTLRVPAERLDETLALLAELALDVRAQTIAREDVTDQYSDIEAQLRTLRATEEELLALLTEVRQRPNATPQDILTIYESLTQIRGQIEQLQGRQNLLDNQIALSTVTIELIPDAANRPLVDAGWRPAIVAREALRALVNTLEFVGSAAIWVGLYLLPLALLAVIPLLVVIWLLRLLARQFQRRRLGRA